MLPWSSQIHLIQCTATKYEAMARKWRKKVVVSMLLLVFICFSICLSNSPIISLFRADLRFTFCLCTILPPIFFNTHIMHIRRYGKWKYSLLISFEQTSYYMLHWCVWYRYRIILTRRFLMFVDSFLAISFVPFTLWFSVVVVVVVVVENNKNCMSFNPIKYIWLSTESWIYAHTEHTHTHTEREMYCIEIVVSV